VDEREMIARVIARDPAAERALYDAHVDRIYRLSFRLAGDDDLARDFTQETFIRAFNRIDSFRMESSLATWLHSIAVSVALNGLRGVHRLQQRETPLADVDAPISERQADPDLRERLAQATDALAPGYRAVFVMHDIEGYTHEEIGAVLGIEAGTSKAQLFRARARLRVALADFATEWIA
jgi:RNA polymerase sigma-70 factor, ECF subfamily